MDLRRLRVPVALLALLCTVSQGISQDQGRRCWVEDLVGSVKIRRGNSPKWIDARPNMPLKEKDAVRTFVESRVTVRTSEGTSLVLGENSTLEMATLSEAKGGIQNTNVKILNGSLMSDVKKLVNRSSKFAFETPTATAAIRGTRVGFEVSSEQTDIRVYEGRVFVEPLGGGSGAELGANQMTSVARGQRSVEAQALTRPDSTAHTDSSTLVDSSTVPDTAVAADTVARPDTSVGPPKDTVAADTAGSGSRRDTVSADTVRTVKADTTAATDVSLSLSVDKPAEGTVVAPGAAVEVVGSVLPATAKVTVRGAPVAVSAQGTFRSSVPGPRAPGEYTLPVEAVYRTQTKRVVVGFVVKAWDKAVTLNVTAPVEGARVTLPTVKVAGTTAPGAVVEVAGVRMTAGSGGEFAGEVTVADQEGSQVLEFEAVLGDKSVSLSRTIIYAGPAAELVLRLETPVDKAVIDKPTIKLTGSVNPGAELSVSGVKGLTIAVQSSGRFEKEIPIPDEEGEIVLEVEAALGGKSASVTRRVTYRPGLELVPDAPTEKQLVCRTTVPVSGRAAPASAEISVNGKVFRLNTNGRFQGFVVIPDEPGEHEIAFEAVSGDRSISATRVVRYEPAAEKTCNTAAPVVSGVLPAQSRPGTLWFTVYDQTGGDEVTFHREIDGSRDSETGAPNSRFRVELETGEHRYSVHAEDMAGNRSAVLSGTVKYLPATTPVTIRMRKPTTVQVLVGLPPGRPVGTGEGAFEPVYTVDFTVDNLPDDNPQFLKAVTVRNANSGWSDQGSLIDTDFQFDVELKAGVNHVVIEVKDINDRIVRHEFDIVVR